MVSNVKSSKASNVGRSKFAFCWQIGDVGSRSPFFLPARTLQSADGTSSASEIEMSVRGSSLLTRRVLARPAQSPFLQMTANVELHTDRRAKYPNGGGVNGADNAARGKQQQQTAAGVHDRRKRQYRPPTPPAVAKSDFFSDTKDGNNYMNRSAEGNHWHY